jgi:hypothetical protein
MNFSQSEVSAVADMPTQNEIRIVQASLLGSILANLLLILGMAFAAGGLRYQEQVSYDTTNGRLRVLTQLDLQQHGYTNERCDVELECHELASSSKMSSDIVFVRATNMLPRLPFMHPSAKPMMQTARL